MEEQELLVGDIMSSPLITASPEASVQSIIETLVDRHISAVIIQEPDANLAYIITHGDILRWLAKHPEEGVGGLVARDLMHGPVMPINAKDPISKAVKVMVTNGFKRVVVENDEGEKIGIVSTTDILEWNVELFRPGTPFLLQIIVKDSGIVLYSCQFHSGQDMSVLDPNLLGSSITAISSLTDELISKSGKHDLKVIRKENYVLMMEAGEILKGLLVADRESIELRKSLKHIIAVVEEANWDVLTKCLPECAPPQKTMVIQPHVEKCFAHFLLSGEICEE
ncbi:MAG TPA: CBS domain-containing protein [Candidatus Lokiarchaeia archaeon]|nr:CBS domain-containing protein [Candidatus Lokiarchaeia archaeon]